MDRRGPLAGNYPAAVALVVCALVPFLALAASLAPLTKLIGADLHLSRRTLELTTAMSDAGYAVGTVIAVQFAQHLRQRRMLLLYVTVFVVAAVVAAAAPTRGLFVAALVLEGLCTSLMLIAAVPPLVTGFGADKTPTTGVVMNLCIFGAVAAGPSIGTFEAGEKDWRTLFWIVAAIAVAAWILALLTFEDAEPQDRGAPWDWLAIAMSLVGCVAAFFGAAELEIEQHATALALATLFAGLALVVTMIVHQYRKRNPLMPVEQLATTFPVVGILVALAASAGAFGLMDLSLTALEQRDPTQVALLFLPELGAAMVTAAIFGALFRTRFTPLYAIGGLVVLCAGAALLTGVATGGDLRIAVGAGLLGLGVGAAVSPGLFIAGFSLGSAQIQRVFALIELLRGVTAFLFGPVVLYLAGILAPQTAAGIADAVWVCFGVCAAGVVAAVLFLLAGGARLQRPDLERWQDEGEPAWDSPGLLAALHRRRRPMVADAMVALPAVHPPWTTVAELRSFFADEHVHMALLVDEGELVGTVERRDLSAAPGDGTPALAIAELDGRTVAADTALSAAVAAMRRERRRRLAVTTGDSLVGLLCLKAKGDGFCSDEDVAAGRRERHSAERVTASGRRD